MSFPQERLDEVKVETLRAWGEGLQADPREEIRAAGRAITMLVEEIERLNIDLWHARTQTSTPEAAAHQAAEHQVAAHQTDAPPVPRPLPHPLPTY